MDSTGDAELAALLDELRRYPGVSLDLAELEAAAAATDVVLPVRIADGDRELSFFSTLTTFGTAIDITLADLAVEAFSPADELTREVLRERFEIDGTEGR